jgi:DNA-binding winged helix-turn-helix (wHTH) protein
MVFVSSRPKSSTSGNAVAADIARLLQSNAGLEPVTPRLTAAAEHLRGLGLITYRQNEYVCCAFTEDEDFPYSNRTCTGRLSIKATLDENAKDYRCSECGRIIFPHRHRKRRFQEIRARVVEDGAVQFVQERLVDFGDAVTAVDGVHGAWRISLGVAGVHVCLADFCENQRLLSLQWAQQNPTCYVAANPRAIERFIAVDWVCRTTLADMVIGKSYLADVVRVLASDGEPHGLPALATPVYADGAHRPEIQATSAASTPKAPASPEEEAKTENNGITVDEQTFTVTAYGKSHRFTGRSKLLFFLLARIHRRSGHQVPFSALCEKDDVWGDAIVEDVTIRGAASRLRKTLKTAGMAKLAAAIVTGHYQGRPFILLNIPTS